MKKLEKSGKMRLVAVNSSSHHHQQQQRIIEEIDFFKDERPRKLIILPQRKGHSHAAVEILFPEILINNSSPKKRAHVDDHVDVEEIKRRKIDVEVFGVNMIIISDNDDDQMIIHHDEQQQQVLLSAANYLIKKQRVRISSKKPRINSSSCNSNVHIDHQEVQQRIRWRVPPPRPSVIHTWMFRHIQLNGGSQPELLFEKKLEKSDVNEGLGRLFVTRSDNLLDALTEAEKTAVLDGEGIRVCTFDEEGRVYELFLKRWPSLKICVLNHHWRKLFGGNKLEKGDIVKAWGYRDQNAEFRMVITFIRNDHE